MSNNSWTGLENLILVAGHAVYVGEDYSEPEKDDNWYLQPFQKGEPPFYIEHTKKGVEIAAEDSKSLLVFSGGQTRHEAGPRSEAQSYWMIAQHYVWWGRKKVESRSTTEEYGLDSFQNVLFGICRFNECVGKYPEQITIVSWSFKEERFGLHVKAIRYPQQKVIFIGANNPVDLEGAMKGESKAVASFVAEQYGTGLELGKKRVDRNPFKRIPPYSLSCPEVKPLLEHEMSKMFAGALPW